MRFHPDPAPASLSAADREKLALSPQVRAWAKRLADGQHLDGAITEEQFAFICTEVERRRITDRRDHGAIDAALAKTAPLIQLPTLNQPFQDIELIMALPEMRDFWRNTLEILDSSVPRRRGGFAPNYAGTLGVMVSMAITGISPHVDDNLEQFQRDLRLREVFTWAHETAVQELPAYSGCSAPQTRQHGRLGELAAPSAGRFSELSRRLALPVIAACKQASMEMLREIEYLLHEEGRLDRTASVLDDVMTDGTDAPAWVPQRGGGGRGEPKDVLLRRNAPDAGYRAYIRASGQGGGGKLNVTPTSKLQGARLTRRLIKDWRGYYVNILASTRLNLPVQATVLDAATHEPDGLIPLLSDVHRNAQAVGWEFAIKRLAADSAYDENRIVRLCEVGYGIDPVFVRDKSRDNDAPFYFDDGDSRSDAISYETAEGQLVCRMHGRPMNFDSFVKPPRTANGQPLRPGAGVSEEAFRVRGRSDCGCGRPSMKAKADWRRLTAIPHHPHGRPDLHALRTALEGRLNGIEMINARLKVGHKLALAGPARTRLVDKDVIEALIQIALLSMVAAVLVDRRLRAGLPLDPSGNLPSGIEIPDVPSVIRACEQRRAIPD